MHGFQIADCIAADHTVTAAAAGGGGGGAGKRAQSEEAVEGWQQGVHGGGFLDEQRTWVRFQLSPSTEMAANVC